MIKIQEVTRKNGSVINSVNLPKEIIQEANWKKGDELKVTFTPPNKVELTKKENGQDNKIENKHKVLHGHTEGDEA